MNDMKNFEWVLNAPFVSWTHDEKRIVKSYNSPIRSAVPLRDETGVAVVEPFEEKGRDNAVVFNSDGTERFRLRLPVPEPHGNCFDQMYYIREKLTAIANLRGVDFACELNERTGDVTKVYETR